MREAILALIGLPPSNPSEVVIDLFSPKETPLYSLRKKPFIDNPNTDRGEVDEEMFKLISLHSMQYQEARQTHELEAMRGTRPFGHAATTEDTTTEVKDEFYQSNVIQKQFYDYACIHLNRTTYAYVF